MINLYKNIKIDNYSLEQKKLVCRILKRFHFSIKHLPLYDVSSMDIITELFIREENDFYKTIYSAIVSILNPKHKFVFFTIHTHDTNTLSLKEFIVTIRSYSDFVKKRTEIDTKWEKTFVTYNYIFNYDNRFKNYFAQ